jgi:hypothetical protein
VLELLLELVARGDVREGDAGAQQIVAVQQRRELDVDDPALAVRLVWTCSRCERSSTGR